MEELSLEDARARVKLSQPFEQTMNQLYKEATTTLERLRVGHRVYWYWRHEQLDTLLCLLKNQPDELDFFIRGLTENRDELLRVLSTEEGAFSEEEQKLFGKCLTLLCFLLDTLNGVGVLESNL